QRLGRDVEWETQGHMGFHDWPPESSRQSGGSEKTRRDLPLEFRLDLDLDVGGRLRFGARFSPEEIKVALDRVAAAERDLKRFEARITHLCASTNLAVLNPCVMDLQLPLGSYDIIGAVTFVKEITEDTEFPIITGIINQGRFWDHAFQTELVSEQPDQATAGGDYRILIERAADAEHAEDFIFLERESEKGFPRNVDCIAPGIAFEIGPGIDLDTGASMIVHHVFKRQ